MKKVILCLIVISLFTFGMGRKPAKIETENVKDSSSEEKAPDFSLKDLSDKQVQLKDFQGKKVVLLVFWATWCHYCVQEIPELKNLYNEFKDKDFEILAINIQESKEKVKSFVNKNEIKYTVLLDDGTIAKKYNIYGIPTNIIIDKKGNIKSLGMLPQDPKSFIENLLH
jgi:peroxiredoxin